MRRDLIKLRREKEKAQAVAAQAAAAAAASAHTHAGLSTYTPTVTSPSSAHKRKRDEERDAASKSKRKKMISTTSKDSKRDIKLYCVCKTPYDESKYELHMFLFCKHTKLIANLKYIFSFTTNLMFGERHDVKK